MMICVKCLVDLRPKKNGVLVARDRYHVQRADLLECPECGIEILGRGGEPLKVETAEAYYSREVGLSHRLYLLDKKVILEERATDGKD